MAALITADDLQAAAPADMDQVRLAQLASDIDAVLLGALPCLATLEGERRRRAVALVRMAVAGSLDAGTVVSETRTRGPFSASVRYADRGTLLQALGGELVQRLAGLTAATRVPEHGMYTVQLIIPPVTG